jgi:hypothetical protein
MKLKTCKQCKVKFEPSRPLQMVCSSKCGYDYVKTTKQKQQKEFAIVERKYKDEKKLTASLLNTKTQVHAYVRKRDEGKNCISCNKPHEKTFEAGHHYSGNSFLTLKFNLDNIHGQCLYCNRHLESNFDNYALRLPDRIGKESYNKLVELAGIDKRFQKVWNLENLKKIRDKIKQLK